MRAWAAGAYNLSGNRCVDWRESPAVSDGQLENGRSGGFKEKNRAREGQPSRRGEC